MTVCERCGSTYGIGDWYDCPHGRYGGTAIPDDYPGGLTIENMGNEPVTVYSKSELLREADKRNLRLRDQWAGPGDRYLSNWAAISPKTLDDAKALLERVGTAAGKSRATLETAEFTVRPWRG
jgi:hypothetical protein